MRVALPTEGVDRITARVARWASNSPHPDTLRPGSAARRVNRPAGWGHPALRGDKKSLCGIQPDISPHPARAAPPSPKGEGSSVRQIFSSRPGNAAWRENRPAGWGHPALRGNKKIFVRHPTGRFPLIRRVPRHLPPKGEGFSLCALSKFFPPPT